MQNRILVVEDDADWSALIKDTLERRGYKVESVASADQAMAAIADAPPDLFVLDVNLGGISGLKLCAMLREDSKTAGVPVLMLTTMNREKDKVQGLSAGADDYLTKPFGNDELAARVMALLRRSGGMERNAVLRVHDVSIDLDRHEVSVKGKLVELRPKEFTLLVHLMRQPGRVMSKAFLAEAVWGKDLIVTSQTLAQHVKNLRARLGTAAKYLETVDTFGYRFKD